MSVIERIARLIRANLSLLLERSKDPEAALRQTILEIEKEKQELKARLAVVITDKRFLQEKSRDNQALMTEWKDKAERSVAGGNDDLARNALDRYLAHKQLAEDFEEQVEAQNRHITELKALFKQVEQKLDEARSNAALLQTQQRRTRILEGTCSAAKSSLDPIDKSRAEAAHAEAVAREKILAGEEVAAASESTREKLARLERQDEIERLLNEMKSRG